MDGVQKALAFAFEHHGGQTRKVGGAPYIVHILDVARLLLCEPGVSEEVVIGGILHDLLEDTGCTPQDIRREFGEHVLSLVLFATEPDKGPAMTRQEKTRTWRTRKEHSIKACAQASREQLLIILADKLSNLAALRDDLQLSGERVWEYFNASKEDTAWFHRSLRDAVADRLKDTRLFRLYDRQVDPFVARP